MADLNDALNELAARGTPRGFDEVFAAAERDAARGSAFPVANSGASGGDLDPIPLVDVEPVARPRRPMHSAITAAGIAALVLVGGLAVNAAVGSGGGAGSPESAVRRLADAISHEDPLAAADVIAPDEVRSLHDTLSNAERKAAELQVVETAGAPLAGVDFDVSGLDLKAETLADGVAKVTVDAGKFTASTHKAQFSPLMQKVLHGSNDNTAESDLSQLAQPDLPAFVVTVRQGGNWYVSAAYTVLEYVREANHLPAADFGSGQRALASLGADTPDAAVQDAMRALQQRDWAKLMTLVAPDEIPVYDYRAALTALARQDDSTDGGGGWFTLDAMTTSAQVDGDHAKVSLHAAGASDSSTWSIDGGCFKVTPKDPNDGTAFSYCGEDENAYGIFALPFISLQQDSQISLVREDGRWFVTPVDTALEAVNSWIDRLDRRTLYTMLGIPGSLPPDGPLVLGQPVTFDAASRNVRILSLDAHKGEVLIGQGGDPFMYGPGPQLPDAGYVFLRVYGPDGAEVYEAQGILDGQAFTVPADGRYTFAFQKIRGDGTAIVWDYADAPASVKQLSPGGRSTCTYGENESSCSSSSGTATPGYSGSGSESGGAVIANGCSQKMLADPQFQQLCAQFGSTDSTYLVGPMPTIAVSGNSGSGSASATSVPGG